MSIYAVRFTTRAGPDEFRAVELDENSRESLLQARADNPPVAYVLRDCDLDKLRIFDDLVVNCGVKEKDSPIELARLMLGKGRERIPFARACYSSTGRLKRGVRALLQAAIFRGEPNLYLIGVGDLAFEKLMLEARTLTETKKEKERTGSDESPITDEADADRKLMALLPDVSMPPELCDRYIGQAIEARVVRRLIVAAAKSAVPVLIMGDSGTGKELVARALHDYSGRPGRFVALNCAGLPTELFESELFGYVKGAHNTAFTDKTGCYEEAQNGTLFLDEIGDLCLAHQAKILRSLQECQIRRIGATVDTPVNARVLAASNHDLNAMVQAGRFREDLFYRLRQFLIRTPTLRRHREDIPLLAQHLWSRLPDKPKKNLPREIIAELQCFSWPGNVRELKTVLSCMLTLFTEENLTVEKLRFTFLHLGYGATTRPAASEGDLAKTHRAECLRQLFRADEVVRASKVAIRPVLVAKKPLDKAKRARVIEDVRRRLSELELLCMRPMLFYTEAAFDLVYQFKGQIIRLLEILPQDSRKARHCWKALGAPLYTRLMSTLFTEVQNLLRSA